MTRLPRPESRDLLAALRTIGFEVSRVKGSHYFLKHPDGRTTVLPMHVGETIGPGLLQQILEDCNLTAEELRKIL